MSVIADLPDLRPSLLLDFANSHRVHPLLQCTRASTATCYGPDGRLRTVAANVPRIDYNPATGKCRGLLSEEGRTNLLLQSADTGASPWSGSAIDNADTEVGIDGVLMKGWRKDSVNNNRQQTVASVAPGALSVSFFGINKPRTGFVSFAITEQNGSPVLVRANVDTVTGAVTRDVDSVSATITATPVNGGVIVRVTINKPSAGARLYLYPGRFDVVDSTVSYYGAIQMEAGAFPTSYIPTTTAQVSRAADRIWMAGIQLPPAGYTLAGDVVSMWGGEYVAILSDSPTALGSFIGMRHASYGSYINSTEGARTIAVTPRPSDSVPFKFAAAMTNASARSLGAVDGGLSQSAGLDSTADLVSRNILKIGATSSAVLGALWVKRLAIYPAALTAASLQRLTV